MLPNAAIEALNELTGIRSSSKTNNEGQFTFNFLPVGTYRFTAQASGFKVEVREHVRLSAGQTVPLPFQLSVSAAQTSLTVTGTAVTLNADTADQHLTVGTQEVRELPLAKKDWTGLLQLGTGVSKVGNDAVSLNGLPPAGFTLTVDGTNAFADAELPSAGFYQGFNTINTVNSEAIAEVSTTKGIAPASVGSSMSGSINLITKSGSNQFHGSLLEINSVAAYGARNQFLDAKPDPPSNVPPATSMSSPRSTN